MIELKCRTCGKPFKVKNYRVNTAKYCSRTCCGKGEYQERRDKGCGLAAIDYSHLIGNTFRKGKRSPHPYPKGHIPWNKGLKGIHLSKNTEFKPGRKSMNKLPVGSITHRSDKNETVRNYIKVAEPNVWKTYSTYLWEQTYGGIPNGCVIHHINQDALDDRLENFDMLTRAEHAYIHAEHSFPHKKNIVWRTEGGDNVNLSGIDECYVRELIKNHKHPFVIEFYSDWCGPCKQMSPLLDELDKTVDVLKINIEEQPALTREYGIHNVPVLLYIKNGEIRKTASGAMSQEELLRFVGN